MSKGVRVLSSIYGFGSRSLMLLNFFIGKADEVNICRCVIFSLLLVTPGSAVKGVEWTVDNQEYNRDFSLGYFREKQNSFVFFAQSAL